MIHFLLLTTITTAIAKPLHGNQALFQKCHVSRTLDQSMAGRERIFQHIHSKGGLATDFFLRAAEAELAPLKCVLMSLGAMINFALSHHLLDVGFVGWRICSLN